MTLDDLLQLALQAGHSAQAMGFGLTEVKVLELNIKNNPPTLTLESIPTGEDEPLRLISIL